LKAPLQQDAPEKGQHGHQASKTHGHELLHHKMDQEKSQKVFYKTMLRF
jgi:hypothetical protein